MIWKNILRMNTLATRQRKKNGVNPNPNKGRFFLRFFFYNEFKLLDAEAAGKGIIPFIARRKNLHIPLIVPPFPFSFYRCCSIYVFFHLIGKGETFLRKKNTQILSRLIFLSLLPFSLSLLSNREHKDTKLFLIFYLFPSQWRQRNLN